MIFSRNDRIFFFFRGILCILCGCLSALYLNGCVLDLLPEKGSSEELSYSALYAERITDVREQQIMKRRSLIFCCTEDFPAELLEQLRSSLAKNQIRMQVLPPAPLFTLTSFLRSVRVDLIAGRFTPEQIHSLHLMPLALHTGGGSSDPVYCFAVRPSSKYLKELLEKITFHVKEKQEKESGHDVRKNRARSGSSVRQKM